MSLLKLPNVDRQPSLQRVLMKFQLQNFQITYFQRLVPRETVNFVSRESLA